MARPFYAEPRLPARLLESTPETRTLCASCNNCTVPQVTGRPGVCRTPEVLERHGDLERAGAYERGAESGADERKAAVSGDDERGAAERGWGEDPGD